MVALVPEILLILEDWVERVHAFSGQQANVSDHSGNASCSERSSGKPNENYFVSWLIVCRDERVDFSNVLTDPCPKESASNSVDDTRSSADTRVVVDYLMNAIETDSPQSSRQSSDVAGNL